MEHHCLSRDEYQYMIHQIIFDSQLKVNVEEDLVNIIERAKNYWDINIIGVNYFLSIITEQIMKKISINSEFISRIYNFKNEMYFTVDELDHKLIDELFSNNLPEARNHYSILLEEAKRSKNDQLVTELERLRGQSFEEDLLRIIEKYYETEIYH